MRIILILFFLLSFGCATGPSPLEVQVLSTAGMAVGLESKKNLEVEDLRKIQAILADSKQILLAALDDDPTTLPQVGNSFVANVNPSYRALINATMGILIVRLQPSIEAGDTALAAEYVEAVIGGAQSAVEDRIEFLDPSPESSERLRS